MASEEILEVKEVANRLKVSTRTVIRLAKRGELVAFKIGDLWRFRRSFVDNYNQQQIKHPRKGRQGRNEDHNIVFTILKNTILRRFRIFGFFFCGSRRRS